MPSTRKPRCGSLQFWPRVRAKRIYANVKNWLKTKDCKPLGFSGYKVGMTHITYVENNKNSKAKGTEVTCPVTIIECPPIKIMGIRFYKNKIATSDLILKTDKEQARKITQPKKEAKLPENTENFDDLKLIIQTQPKLTGLGKKKPEIFETAIGGSLEEKFAFAKENFGKEISVKDVFNEGQLVDIHSITIGKGIQGPVKRFGIGLRSHKSEKSRRRAVLGSMTAARVTYRMPQQGQTGYHKRTEYNKPILKISDKPEEINAKGGFVKYGLVKTTFILLKGSVGGPRKRLIRFTRATRPTRNREREVPSITFISTASKQGR
jgi:large subunit ribosomal protein L3